jgi:hypothetical protein
VDEDYDYYLKNLEQLENLPPSFRFPKLKIIRERSVMANADSEDEQSPRTNKNDCVLSPISQ